MRHEKHNLNTVEIRPGGVTLLLGVIEGQYTLIPAGAAADRPRYFIFGLMRHEKDTWAGHSDFPRTKVNYWPMRKYHKEMFWPYNYSICHYKEG